MAITMMIYWNGAYKKCRCTTSVGEFLGRMGPATFSPLPHPRNPFLRPAPPVQQQQAGTAMSLFAFRQTGPAPAGTVQDEIRQHCRHLREASTRGELGARIAPLILVHSPSDIQRMKRNFSRKVEELPAGYRDRLTAKINEHLLGSFQAVRLMHQQGSFGTMTGPLTPHQQSYWEMVEGRCTDGGGDMAIRFLNYLLAGFCMLVRQEPAHPAGTPFPGGDTVQLIDGIWYCPVREKASDVDAALCPYCPARQTPEIGYLRPPVDGTEHKKQEYIGQIYERHHFNG